MANWKPIPEHPSYFVSDEGQVEKRTKTRGNRPVKPAWKSYNGEWGVQITTAGKRKFYALNHLVWRLFSDLPLPRAIGHVDGNKANCSLKNLIVGQTGRKPVLGNEQVEYIRHTMHKPWQVVADELSISKTTLFNYRKKIKESEL